MLRIVLPAQRWPREARGSRPTRVVPASTIAPMRDLLEDIERWRGDGRRVALARIVAVDGSAPREVGAAMAVNEQSEVAGSLSGGCVEGAVVEEALKVLADGVPRLCRFGYSDDDAFAAGLTCGGTLHVFVELLVG